MPLISVVTAAYAPTAAYIRDTADSIAAAQLPDGDKQALEKKLAIVRKIVEEHGGEMEILDRENDEPGAELRLVFPLKQKAARVMELGGSDEQERIVDRA